MKRQLMVATVALALLAGGGIAQADLIVDTGIPTQTSGGWTLSSGANAQWLAAEFSLADDYYITDIHGWLGTSGQNGQNFTISVYGDGGDIPDSSNLLYSNSATVQGNGGGNWEGYHISWGNGLLLSQGTYWVSFEVRPGNYSNPYSGFMPGSAPNPLANEAFLNASGWHGGNDDLNIGIQIQGNAPVPEPTTMLLFGSGLAGLIAARRRKNR